MSRSRHIAKQFKDWWGARPLSHYSISNNAGVNKFFKRLLHKIERKQWQKDIDIDDVDPPNDLDSPKDIDP